MMVVCVVYLDVTSDATPNADKYVTSSKEGLSYFLGHMYGVIIQDVDGKVAAGEGVVSVGKVADCAKHCFQAV